MLRAAHRIFSLGAAFVGVYLIAFSAAIAQIPNIPNANQLQRTLQGQQDQNAGQLQTLTPNVEVYQPSLPEQRPLAPPSRLENLYNSRLPNPPSQTFRPGQPPQLGQPLQSGQPQQPGQLQQLGQNQNGYLIQTANPLVQFGYDVFGVPTPFSSAQIGAPQDGYILGPGDEVVVVLRGGTADQSYAERVNRDGQIILPKLTPIQAAGRSFGDLRNDVERRVAQTYISTNVYLSLGEIRQISVLITGDVRAPGSRVISALATPLDALLLSGGIAKTGSLRNISLIRGNQTRTIDLYSIITQGDAVTLGALQNGDRIFVPPLQRTIAVAGLVRHPGIYELKNGETSLDAKALIELAGGFEIAGTYRLSKISLEPDGSTSLVSLPNGGVISNGEILLVDNARDQRTDTVALRGAVKLPNVYPRSTTSSIRQLIRSGNDLAPDAYAAFALIAHRDLALNVTTLEPFSLSRVLSGVQDIPLRNEDIIYVFTDREIRDLANGVAQLASYGPTSGPTMRANNPGAPGASSTTALPQGAATAQFGQPAQNGQFSPGVQNGQAPQNYVNGQNPTGGAQFQNGVVPGISCNQFPGAQFAGGQFTGTQFPGTQFPGTQFPGTQFPSTQFPGTQFPSTQFPGSQFPAAQFYGAQQSTAVGVARAQAASAIDRENCFAKPSVGAVIAETLGVSEQILTSTFNENLVWLYDEVKDPGPYLATQGTSLGELVQVAGGPLRTADLSAVEVTSTSIDASTGTSRTIRTEYRGTIDDFKRVMLQPLDVIRFRPIFSDRDQGRVTIAGEVRYPGTFDIRRGEKLSSVLARAGGLTDQAYPYGTVFTRWSAAIAETDANLREARELESALALAAQRGSLTGNLPTVTPTTAVATTTTATTGGPTSVDVVSNLVSELRTTPGLGRITVTADPAVLQVKPELDIGMEGGDTVYIPKRPSTVTVTGEVLNTGSFAYRNDFNVQDYIDLAGGSRESADQGRIFVLMPDGTARPVEDSWLTFSHNNIIPPGSTIVVPIQVAPFNFLTTLANIASITQITSQIAITAAALAIIKP